MRSVLVAIGAVLLLATPASAATLSLTCPGAGGQRVDEGGLVTCGALPDRTVTVLGAITNDGDQPVAAPVVLTRTRFVDEAGGSFVEDEDAPSTVRAGPDGRFTFTGDPQIIERWTASVAPDPALGIASRTTATVEVRRRLVTTVRKLGAGKVRVAIDGRQGAVEVRVLGHDGQRLKGVAPRELSGGRATTFHLGRRSGTFVVKVLDQSRGGGYWKESKKLTFTLRSGA